MFISLLYNYIIIFYFLLLYFKDTKNNNYFKDLYPLSSLLLPNLSFHSCFYYINCHTGSEDSWKSPQRTFSLTLYFLERNCVSGWWQQGQMWGGFVGERLKSPACLFREGNGTPSSTLAWKIPWMEEPGGLRSMGSLSQTWLNDFTFIFSFMHWRRKWQPTPVVLPGESQGWGSLVGCRL